MSEEETDETDEETLIPDHREVMSPAQHVEQRLTRMLLQVILVGQLQRDARQAQRRHGQDE